LTNPPNATNLLVGVFSPALTEPLAQVLEQMGARAAFVVHGGTDELSLAGPNRVSHLHNGRVTTYEFDALSLDLPRAGLDELSGNTAEENAAITRSILDGSQHGARRNAVLLNAAFALSTESNDLAAGLAAARYSIDSGSALRVLDAYVHKTRRFLP
jgi:anthranilate phosphoribosyltransferase